MKKKLLLLLSLALVAMTSSAITLYVSDHTFTNTSGTESFTTSNGGTVTYDGSNKILTLNNVKIERSGSSKNCINNVDVSGLKINCTGTNIMIAANADAIICGAATTINVTSGQTSAASSASGQCGLQTYGANVTVTGSGRMLFTASNGYAVKGNSGNENITFQIKESTITGSRGCLNNFNRVTINPVSTSTTLSTTITLAATNNSSYN
ncbi:MAG: hypothetical protein IK092_03870, partial [Muribaculaceae bacterium]|nr:hypothetical protein [Muribaculaceae bacterium]